MLNVFRILILIAITAFFAFSDLHVKAQINTGNIPPAYYLDSIAYFHYIPDHTNAPEDTVKLNLDCDTTTDVLLISGGYWSNLNGPDYHYDLIIVNPDFQVAYLTTGPCFITGFQQQGLLADATLPFMCCSLTVTKANWQYNCYGAGTHNGFEYLPFRKKISATEFQYGWLHMIAPQSNISVWIQGFSWSHLPLSSIIRDTINCHENYTFIDSVTYINLHHDTLHYSIFPNANNGCDSLVTTFIHVIPEFTSLITDSACTGSPYQFPDGDQISVPVSPTIHYSYLLSQNGCDSLVITQLTSLPTYNTSFQHNVYCHDTVVLPTGDTFTNILKDTTIIYHYYTAINCDSIITHVIHVNAPLLPWQYYTVCSDTILNIPNGPTFNFSYVNANPYYGNPHTFVTNYMTTDTAGCPLTGNLQVIVHKSFPIGSKHDNVSICLYSNYTFADGQTYNNISADTFHNNHFTTLYGCDSVVTTHVFVTNNQAIYAADTFQICRGGDFTFHDGTLVQNVFQNITHTSHFQSNTGCDSNWSSYLKFYPTYVFRDTFQMCNGGDFTFHDGAQIINVIQSVAHISHFQTIHGCDSSWITYLKIAPTFATNDTFQICTGSRYTFPDGSSISEINSNVSHASLLQSNSGCDSIINTQLIVHKVDTAASITGIVLTLNTTNALYQWFDCKTGNIISGETNQSYTATYNGFFAVIITDSFCTDTSNCIAVNNIGSTKFTEPTQLFIYPNPTDGIFILESTSKIYKQDFGIINALGEKVSYLSKNLTPNKVKIEMSQVAPGIYYLRHKDLHAKIFIK